mmetsp:Transcript_3288/g.8491  ORF Transcript_3288/g.8491 Transcript_3288/m.8491 type:complete len:90 (-) Transcript_3288:627-896(-)
MGTIHSRFPCSKKGTKVCFRFITDVGCQLNTCNEIRTLDVAKVLLKATQSPVTTSSHDHVLTFPLSSKTEASTTSSSGQLMQLTKVDIN